MGTAKTLIWFYSIMGLIFRWEIILIYIFNLVKILIPILLFNRFKNYWLIPIILVYLYFTVTPEILIFAFPLILILFAQRFQTLDMAKRIFIISGMLISIKVFFALTLLSYGVFFIPFALISIFILIPNSYKKTLLIITLLCALVLGVQNTKDLLNKNVRISTKNGIIYANQEQGSSLSQLVKYIESNIPKTDRIVVYPECLLVNFMTEHRSDNKFYSLIPLYVEIFGEDLINERLRIIRPEYVILSNYDTSNYYYSYFGKDYAGRIYQYILDNYEKQVTIGKDLVFTVFKLKS